MTKNKSLTQTELDAKKFHVLSILHTNYPKLTFHVMSYRDDDYYKSIDIGMAGPHGVEPDENTIVIIGSFFNDKGIELSAFIALDATDEAMNLTAHDIGERFEKDREKKQDGKSETTTK